MKKIFVIIVFFAGLTCSYAQSDIVGYEYWFNDDFANKTTTMVNSSQQLMINTTISTTGLIQGINTLNFRSFDDSGKYSSIVSQFFYKIVGSDSQPLPELVSYEYWIDDDYSSATLVNEAPDLQFSISELISMSYLNDGLHTFNIRVKSNLGLWSSVVSNFFYKIEEQIVIQNAITEYRYWFDDDFVNSVTVPLLSNQQVNIIEEIDLTQKQKGFYDIHFQFKDSLGRWSTIVVDPVEKISFPVANFSYSVTQNCDSSVVNFIDNSIDGDVYFWDFGDGNTSSDASPENIYYNTGTFIVSQTVTDINTLADSTIFQTIVIGGNTFSAIAPVVCDNYISPSGNIFDVSGVYIDTIPNSFGCDSIITIDLVVNHSTNFTDMHSACSSYTWIDGNTYYASTNTPTFVIPYGATNGCDSIVTLDLTINQLPENGVTQDGITLTANQVGASYQWLDCDDGNSVIMTEIGQSFTATEDGNYAVQVTMDGCSDTSNCYAITTVSIEGNRFDQEVKLYPNPGKDQITIDLGENYNEIDVTVQSLNGQIIKQSHFKNQQKLTVNLDIPEGIYLIFLVSDEKSAIMKLVLQ